MGVEVPRGGVSGFDTKVVPRPNLQKAGPYCVLSIHSPVTVDAVVGRQITSAERGKSPTESAAAQIRSATETADIAGQLTVGDLSTSSSFGLQLLLGYRQLLLQLLQTLLAHALAVLDHSFDLNVGYVKNRSM